MRREAPSSSGDTTRPSSRKSARPREPEQNRRAGARLWASALLVDASGGDRRIAGLQRHLAITSRRS
jgi:hypothetical protein